MQTKISILDHIRIKFFPILSIPNKPSVQKYLEELRTLEQTKALIQSSNAISKVR